MSQSDEFNKALQSFDIIKQRGGLPIRHLQKLSLLLACINQEEGQQINLKQYDEIDIDDCTALIKLQKSSQMNMFLQLISDYTQKFNLVDLAQNVNGEIEIRTDHLKLWEKKQFQINISQRSFEILRSNKKDQATKKKRIMYLKYYEVGLMKPSDKRNRFVLNQLEYNKGYYKELICGTTDMVIYKKIVDLLKQLCKTESFYDSMVQSKEQQPIQIDKDRSQSQLIKNESMEQQMQVQIKNSFYTQTKQNNAQNQIDQQLNDNKKLIKDDEGEFQDAEEFEEKHPDVIKQNNYPSVFNSILEEGKLHPNYLSTLQDQFQQIHSTDYFQILRSLKNPLRFRCIINIKNNSALRVFQALAEIDFMKKWNGAINQQDSRQIILINSKQSVVVYEKRNKYGYFYLPRDFIYIRHFYEIDQRYFIIDKSIEHEEYQGQYQIIRGEINYTITRIQEKNNNNEVEILMETEITNGGFSSTDQDVQITMSYLKEIANIKSFLETYSKQPIIQTQLLSSLQSNANQNNRQSYLTSHDSETKDDQINSEPKNIEQDIQQSLALIPNSNTYVQAAAINTDQRKEVDEVKYFEQDDEQPIDLNDYLPTEIVINNNLISEEYKQRIKQQIIKVEKDNYQHLCLTQYYVQEPKDTTTKEYIKNNNSETNFFLKDEWVRDTKNGGLLFVSQRKIEALNSVIKFMIKKIGSNLLSGKSVLSVSLPVIIFETRSNLERFAYSFIYAPIYLERGAQMKTPEEQMKMTIAFGLSSIVMYLSLEKPFNPILGETYQGFIDGCPVFVEQISHHPPICAFQLYGRGYILDGHIETVANMGANSIVGKNVGYIRVTYKNTATVQIYLLVPGVLQGTTFGQKYFNLQGKGYCIDIENRLVWDATFNPGKSSVFAKSEHAMDYFTGAIYKVKPSGITKYQKEGYAKYTGLDLNKDVNQRICSTEGIWNEYLQIEGERIWDIKTLPLILKNNPNPLPSDSNYRLDILYWKLNDFDSSSKHKEILEIIQRKDKKLREKQSGKKH